MEDVVAVSIETNVSARSGEVAAIVCMATSSLARVRVRVGARAGMRSTATSMLSMVIISPVPVIVPPVSVILTPALLILPPSLLLLLSSLLLFLLLISVILPVLGGILKLVSAKGTSQGADDGSCLGMSGLAAKLVAAEATGGTTSESTHHTALAVWAIRTAWAAELTLALVVGRRTLVAVSRRSLVLLALGEVGVCKTAAMTAALLIATLLVTSLLAVTTISSRLVSLLAVIAVSSLLVTTLSTVVTAISTLLVTTLVVTTLVVATLLVALAVVVVAHDDSRCRRLCLGRRVEGPPWIDGVLG